MNIVDAISSAKLKLNMHNIQSSKLDSEILLSAAIKKDRKFIILNPYYNIDKNSYNRFKNLINKRSYGKPVAYLIKKKEC